jgi:glycosyltransferase involved in cell wall biosynthesis
VEKNVEAFLNLPTPGHKVLVGDGPARAQLKARFPQAHFLGARFGAELASIYAAADVFVFPSLTDTFGLVLLEALACGTPVASFPAAGPADVLKDSLVATLDWDLAKAVERSLTLKREDCRKFALSRSWDSSVKTFAESVIPFSAERTAEQPEPNLRSAPHSRYYAVHGL